MAFTEPNATITTFDQDTIAAVVKFSTSRPVPYSTGAQALDKLIARAVRAQLHTMTDDEFERLLSAESVTK